MGYKVINFIPHFFVIRRKFMKMVKHHLPPGLDIEVGKEMINGWKISFIEPRKHTNLFPVEIKENEIPDHYFFIIVKRDEKGEYKSLPGFVPYDDLFKISISEFIIDWIQKMEGRI